MKRVSFLIIFTLIIFLHSSCEKDELTLPTEVSFEFSMESYQAEESNSPMNKFIINEGTLIINSIEFDGQREEGEDYYFVSQFTSPLIAEVNTGVTSQTVSFDAPQGIYNKIDISFSLGAENENSLILNGVLKHGASTEIPIRIEYTFQEKINVRGSCQEGNEQIVLTKDKKAVANVIFNTPDFFKLISYGKIKDATTQNIEGQETILINNQINDDIFNLLASRIDDSIQVVFE
jgi:hypothetical protein